MEIEDTYSFQSDDLQAVAFAIYNALQIWLEDYDGDYYWGVYNLRGASDTQHNTSDGRAAEEEGVDLTLEHGFDEIILLAGSRDEAEAEEFKQRLLKAMPDVTFVKREEFDDLDEDYLEGRTSDIYGFKTRDLEAVRAAIEKALDVKMVLDSHIEKNDGYRYQARNREMLWLRLNYLSGEQEYLLKDYADYDTLLFVYDTERAEEIQELLTRSIPDIIMLPREKQMGEIYKLSEVLASANDFIWNSALFLDKNRNWDDNSRCAVLPIDEDDVDPENPEFAKQNGLMYALNMADVQDIVRNAKQQNRNVNESILVKAFLHYYDRDAFIDLNE